MWQHVCTAEHKLKKPRPLSHTPLGSKLHGVLHSTHKQPPGKARGCMGEAGGRQAGRQETTTAFSHQHNAFKSQRDCGDKRWRQRGLAGDQTRHLSKVSDAESSHLQREQSPRLRRDKNIKRRILFKRCFSDFLSSFLNPGPKQRLHCISCFPFHVAGR